MQNVFGPGGPTGPGGPHQQTPQFNLEDLDISKIYRFTRYGLFALALIFLWMGISWAQSFYTDWLWYQGLGYESVLLKVVTTKVGLFLLGVGLVLVLIVPNLYLAHTYAGKYKLINPQVPAHLYQSARRLLGWGLVGVTVLGAYFLGRAPAYEWEMVLRFLNHVSFGETDPVFGRDFSFYVFVLPALDFFRSWLVAVLIAVMLFVGGYYYISVTIRGEMFSFTGRVKSHLALLGAGVMVLVALGHWLSRYELLYSPLGAVYGVGYTDHNIVLPALTTMTLVALACAGILVAAAFYKGKKAILVGVGLWFGLNILAGSVAPGLVQRLVVEPSELARERSYLAENIKHTRDAFNLNQMTTRSHPARGALDRQTIEDNPGTIQNVRLWDEGPLLQSYNQIQFFRLYYDFLAVHTDRYTVNDELRQVMLATRELSADKLPTEAQRWVNRHLQFTHGYGVAMTPVTEVEEGGRPGFFIQDLPPRGEIGLDRPEIYYGLKSLNYLIVRTRMQEFNYPGEEGPVYTHYEGEGGVALNSFFRRLMYAWEFRDINILISGEITPESLIQYRRTVPQRFRTITPFLKKDREAYSVVADGRLFWIQDAYTTTTRYPYSTPWQNSFNYIRNSVKAVVDAYHGTIDYYVSDPDDPIIQTYQAIFPDLFKPMEEMPEYLREHVRYPQDMFTVQTQMLLQYHMEDPVVFYNKEDQWSVPVQHSFGRTEVLRPYYIVARLPGEEKEEFLLIQPFTPINRHNLVGWMAARSDGENYGELMLFRFPTGRHVDGPNQVEARIDNDAIISEQFTLWGQAGSEVFRGILLVIPVGDSLLYAEPVFLTPDALEFPELRRIILADSRQVVMHQTLDDSIDALVGRLPAVAPVVEVDEPDQPATRILPDLRDNLKDGLTEAIDKLQEALDHLKGLVR
ncbi:UPF0182 family membrane protein [Desulfonatronovibrio hydrogenovorans]|uniref:UPF0182 family membrane protein n=1 Tax=Desulfonatronovibrio hydrogenovorans TaxID=53245 RepID=UPI0006911428|nr:UPF0182 family protein [Desulfonatronovibrio hydrogenovorans]